MPFEKLVEELQPERSRSHSPLFQVMFALQNAPVGELELPGLQLRPVERGGEQRSLFDLALSIGESGGRLRCSLGYNTELFESETARRMAQHYEHLLREAVAASEQRVGELEMLSDGEREQLKEWDSTAREYGGRGLAHEQFERRAAERGAEMALRDADAALTYAELDAAANRLAPPLLERGLCPRPRGGVLLGRRVEAGGAVVAGVE